LPIFPYFTSSGYQVAPCDHPGVLTQLGTEAADKNPPEAAALSIIQQICLRY